MVIVLLIWAGVIFMFVNKWGKIRGLEPCAPVFEKVERVVASPIKRGASYKEPSNRNDELIDDQATPSSEVVLLMEAVQPSRAQLVAKKPPPKPTKAAMAKSRPNNYRSQGMGLQLMQSKSYRKKSGE